MAWLDDRLWAHPKVVPLSYKAKWVAVSAILYSHGFGLYGRLKKEHQKAIGSDSRIKNELVVAGLWEPAGDDILIHDWDEHNGKRDAAIEQKRAQDRERKRAAREAKRLAQAETEDLSARTSAGNPQDSPPGHPTDVPPDVQPLSSRARAGARLVTSDGVTNDSVLPSVSNTPEPSPEPEASYDADDDIDFEPPDETAANGAGAGTGDLERLDPTAVLRAAGGGNP